MRLAALWRASDGRTATTGASAPATDVTSAAAATAIAEVVVEEVVVVEVTVDVAVLAPSTCTSSDVISEVPSVAEEAEASEGDAATTKAIGATERR